jgi:hypothetical protein
MAMAYCGTRLSPNIIRTSEGFIIATAQICRSGKQRYKRSEIDPTSGDDTMVDVYRPPSEVTSAATIASAEGKPLTLNHPSKFLTPDSWAWSAKGHMQHIRVGAPDAKTGDIPLIADVHIHDQGLIDRIAHGVRDLSCGYNYELVEGDDGPEMRNIRINHLAVVESGRALSARIVDNVVGAPIEDYESMMARYHRVNPQDAAPAPTAVRQAQDDVLNWGGGENNETTLPGGEGDTPMSDSARESIAIEGDVEDEEIPMGKSKDENRDSQMARLCDLLEKFLGKTGVSKDTTELIPDDEQNGEVVNPAVDEVVNSLRQLRPMIVAAGDRDVARAFNAVMIAAKKGHTLPAERFINAAYDRQPSSESFESAISRRRSELLSGKSPSEPMSRENRAEDRESQSASFQDRVDRLRRQMLSETR